MKELKYSTAIIMMDFSQNYAYVTQDEVQGHFWSRNSCTLHPVVIYAKKEGTLENKSLCFIADGLKHDVSAVHIFIKHTIKYVKEYCPGIKKVFFTDGCGGQYKCCTNFLLLCEFEFVYGLKVEWFFFARSHGKSPCDAIGGTIKRKAAKESLRRAQEDQILNVDDLKT